MPFDKLANDFGCLSLGGRTFIEYVFLGGTALDLRCKTKVLGRAVSRLEDVPWAAVDGALTGQASQGCSVLYLKPRALFRDPFRTKDGAEAWIVLCDTFSPPSPSLRRGEGGCGEQAGGAADWEPHPSNNRAFCEHVMQQAAFLEPWFSCEQQYTLQPLGSEEGRPGSQHQHHMGGAGAGAGYCGLGAGLSRGRDFAEAHMMACLHAGIKVTGVHAQAAPGRWCYELGTLPGLDFADQLWVSRYLLLKLAERHGLVASLEPQAGDGGAAALVRFSTRETREEGCGWQAIQQHVQRLEATHAQHMLVYGTGNTLRMLCPSTTASLGRFSVGVESTGASIRVPHSVVLQHKGYYEDRRPAGNMDPYLVSLMLVCTTCSIPLPTQPGAARSTTPLQLQQQQQQQGAQPAATTASSSISQAKPTGQRRHAHPQQGHEEVHQPLQRPRQQFWGAAGAAAAAAAAAATAPGGSAGGSPSASAGGTASSSAILSELDVEQRRRGIMPDTPDQQVALLGGPESAGEACRLGLGAAAGIAGPGVGGHM